jgi:hypothetical protein
LDPVIAVLSRFQNVRVSVGGVVAKPKAVEGVNRYAAQPKPNVAVDRSIPLSGERTSAENRNGKISAV